MSFDYSKLHPIRQAIPAERQAAKRHYGVHPYFTRRPPNVVRRYIEHYSRNGDRVLDPFGGSGVTAIEAFLSGRFGIHSDINPLGNFIAKEVAEAAYADTAYIRRAFSAVDERCGELVRQIPHMTEQELTDRLRNAKLPGNIELPRTSDAAHFYDLFTSRQLLALSTLKEAIDFEADAAARGQLLLAWSATLAKLNRTFLSAKGRLESRGGSSIFSIYRYKVANDPVELAPWDTFAERVLNVIKAKEEVLREKAYMEAKGRFVGGIEIHQADVLDLPKILAPVDYIFTDPPYGGHIAYLDLSTLWNHWLEFSIPQALREKEIIVGGELGKSEEAYIGRLRESIDACFVLLKKNRWISIVFQHWNVSYFQAILETSENAGSSLQAAVTQVGDTIWSMHKKKNRERVLAGEMILTFFKDGKPKRRAAANHRCEIEQLVDCVLPALSEESDHLHGELLFNRLITEAWNRNALHALRVSREDFAHLLERRGWSYNPQSHHWVRQTAKSREQGSLAF